MRVGFSGRYSGGPGDQKKEQPAVRVSTTGQFTVG